MTSHKLISLLAIVLASSAAQQLFEMRDSEQYVKFLNEEEVQAHDPDHQMAFAFELVRHGARAPIEDRNLDLFPVGEGLLTPEGMR